MRRGVKIFAGVMLFVACCLAAWLLVTARRTQRLDLYGSYYLAAHDFASQNPTGMAQAVLPRLSLMGRVAGPVEKGEGVEWLEGELDGRVKVAFVALLPPDASSSRWAGIAAMDEGVSFLAWEGKQVKAVLAMRERRMSAFWRARCFLHEGERALFHLDNEFGGVDDPLQREAARRTLALHRDILRLRARGGSAYVAALTRAVGRILAGTKKGDPLIALVPRRDAALEADMGAVFGQPLSEEERRERQEAFALHAAFAAIGRRYPQAAAQNRVRLFYELLRLKASERSAKVPARAGTFFSC